MSVLSDLLKYQAQAEEVLGSKERVDWKAERKELARRLGYLQHERLLHLMVTLATGLATLGASIATLFLMLPALYVIDVVLGVLFVAYLVHYRKLENTAQKWYELMGKMAEQ